MAGGLSNRVHRPRHDQIDTELPEFGTRPARVALDTVARLQTIGTHQARVGGERQRSVREARMSTDFFFGQLAVNSSS